MTPLSAGQAEAIAFFIRADILQADPPRVMSTLGDGRVMSFDMDGVWLGLERIPLASLAEDEAAARRLGAALAALFESEGGAERFESGWSAWGRRSDGKVLEIGPFGYQLFVGHEAFISGGQCEAVLVDRE